ncbi:hypothetical protein PT2222_40230 [Paraburkholderia tropica]
MARLDVAQVVADIHHAVRRDAERLGRMQQRGRMRLRVGRGVAAHDAGRARVEMHQLHERIGQTRDLVGDDAPEHAARVEVVEHRVDAGEQRRFHAQIGRIVREEFLAHGGELVVVGTHAEGAADQAPSARRGERTQLLVGRGRKAARVAHLVDGGGEVGRRVGERAVEVEQHGVAGGERGDVARRGRGIKRGLGHVGM